MNFKKTTVFAFFLIFFAIRSFSQVNKYILDSLTETVEQGGYSNIDALVVSQNGKMVYEKYFNGFTNDSLHDSRSSFKSITALLIGIAIDKGYITNINNKVYPYFSEYKNFNNWDDRKDSIVIQDLLEMKSGFDCEEWNGTKDCEDGMTASDDWIKFSLDLPMAHSPGTYWAYTSSNAMLLGGIIAKASKMTVSQFAEQFLFRPLGIKNYRWTKDASGHEMTAGSFYILPTDMIKIGELILNKGIWKGRRIVSAKWIKEATSPINKIEHFSNVGISKAEGAIPQSTYYGYLWYNEEIVTDKFKYNVIFASGNGGQYIMIIADLNLVISFTGNSYNSPKSKLPFQILVKYILPYANATK
jgi:CubicO group peptidase (beta-lactamase class C family)